MSVAVNWDDFDWEEVMPGFERKVVHGQGMSVVRVRLAPGTVVPSHVHAHEQLSTVLSGQGVFVVDGVEIPVNAGAVNLFPGGVEHGLTAGESRMELLDIFNPVREDFPASVARME